MGYSTDFSNSFKLNRPATAEEILYINTFSGTRRMKRRSSTLMELYKGEHGLIPFSGTKSTAEQIYGIDGEFFAKDDGNCGQSNDKSIIEYDHPPQTQPGLWCQWILTDDGTELEWDGSEKFYNYIEWLKYMIDNFFSKWDIILNGEVTWYGEESTDTGKIIVTNNIVKVLKGEILYKEI